MKSISTALLALVFTFTSMSQAQARNTPCSGKMGGVSHCSADGKCFPKLRRELGV